LDLRGGSPCRTFGGNLLLNGCVGSSGTQASSEPVATGRDGDNHTSPTTTSVAPVTTTAAVVLAASAG
jgi:hypothetical protein